MHPQTAVDNSFCALLFIDAWKSQLEKLVSWYLSLYYLCWNLDSGFFCRMQDVVLSKLKQLHARLQQLLTFLVILFPSIKISQTIFNVLKEFL